MTDMLIDGTITKEVYDDKLIEFNRKLHVLDGKKQLLDESINKQKDVGKRMAELRLTLENEEECFTFFEDLCTVNELLSLSQRFEVASMLKKKDTYLKIAEKTGASTATISRVNRSLNYGNDGYTMVFSRMKSYNQSNGKED